MPEERFITVKIPLTSINHSIPYRQEIHERYINAEQLEWDDEADLKLLAKHVTDKLTQEGIIMTRYM